MRRSSTSLIAALLAVLALLTHPVAAAAAQAACSAMGDQAVASAAHAQTDMAGMPAMAKASGVKAASADPCCDQQQKPMDGKSCALACATSCAVPAVLPAVQASQALTYVHTAPLPAHDVWPGDHSPSGLERPPKSIL